MKVNKKFIGFVSLIIVLILLINSGESALSDPITKEGITLTLLEHTYYCGGDTLCESKYNVCGVSNLDGFNLLFRDDKEYKLEDDGTKYFKYDPDVFPSSIEGCYEIKIEAEKPEFTNVDVIPCFNDVCFQEHEWFNTSFLCRQSINFTNNISVGSPFSINDTYGIKSDIIWTTKANETMYIYYKNINCTGEILIGNETDEINWENESSHLGNNPTFVWENENLITYHMAETNTKDSTANGYDAINVGSPTLTTGIYGNGIFLDGSNDALQDDSDSGKLEGFNAGTIEAWIKSVDDDGMMMYSLTDGSVSTDYMVFGLNDFTGAYADESVFFLVTRGGTTQLGMYVRDGDGAYTDGNWHHIAVVTGNGSNQIYVDGINKTITYSHGNSATAEFSNINNPSHMRVGNWFFNNANGAYLNGSIDEVRFYNRSKTASEIRSSYWNGKNNLTFDGSQEVLEIFTSVLHTDFKVNEIVFDSGTYIPIGNFTFNATNIQNLTLFGSMNMKKQTVPLQSQVSIRLTFNNKIVLDVPIRTVSSIEDIGVASIPFTKTITQVGENNLLVEAKEDGSGSVNISEFTIHGDCELNNLGGIFDNSLFNSTFDYSGDTFASRYIFDINKSYNGQTILDASHRFNASGTVTPSCFIQSTDSSIIYSRYLSGVTDVGSSGVSMLDSQNATDTNYNLICSSDDAGETISNLFSLYWLGLKSSLGGVIFSTTNQTTGLTLTGTNNIILNDTVNIKHGNEFEVKTVFIFQSTTGTQTPSFTVRLTNGTNTETVTYARYLSDNNDIGTVKIYTDLENISVGDNVTYSLIVDVPTGETLTLLNASLVSKETTILDIASGDLPPIPNIITRPTNNSQVYGENENITWLAFEEPNEQAVTYNVSLFNKDGTFNATIGETSSLIFYVNYSDYNVGEYDLVVEGCDTSDLCSNTTHNITKITAPSCNVTFNVRDSVNETHLSGIDVSCSPILVDKTSPFNTLLIVRNYNCIFQVAGYNNNSVGFACGQSDILTINVSMVRVIKAIDLNMSLIINLESLPLLNQICLNEDILKRNYGTEVIKSAGAENITRSELVTCDYGCDFFNNRCRENPLNTFIFFIIFMGGNIVFLILPLFILTRRTNKKLLKLIIDMLMMIIIISIDISAIAFLLPNIITFLGIDYFFVTISFNLIYAVHTILIILLFTRNVKKRRYF